MVDLEALNSDLQRVRVWLYDAADALEEWGDEGAAVQVRSTAEILGASGVARRIRMEALVREAAAISTPITAPIDTAIDPELRLGAWLDAERRRG